MQLQEQLQFTQKAHNRPACAEEMAERQRISIVVEPPWTKSTLDHKIHRKRALRTQIYE